MSKERFVLETPTADVETPVVPKVQSIKPFGSTILVEMLTAEEALGTRFYVKKDASVGAPQAYILAFGSKLNAEDVGLKVGDRVVVQGNYVPVPKLPGCARDRGIIEIHNVKAILEEGEVASN